MIFSCLNMLTSFLIIGGVGILVTYCIFNKEDSTPDMIIVTGIVGCGVFSEFVSLFRGVDVLVYTVVILISLAGYMLFVLNRKNKIYGIFKEKTLYDYIRLIGIAIGVAIIIVLFVFNCSRSPITYDDYLYHIQAVKWINKYGVVIGQGLLHYRFGFNSAFLVLQALFDWYFTGFEYHTLNCLFSLLLLIYVLFSNSYGKKTDNFISDCLKIATVWIVIMNMNSIVGMEIDALAILLFGYIIIKITENIENTPSIDWKESLVLAVFCTFGFTVKLSVAILIILPIYLIVLKLYEKQIRDALVIAVSQIIVVLPFIVRSVIITGFILYPIWKIDFFNAEKGVADGGSDESNLKEQQDV